jgi:hypothetical protein
MVNRAMSDDLFHELLFSLSSAAPLNELDRVISAISTLYPRYVRRT